MACVLKIDAGKKSVLQGMDRSSPNALIVLHWCICSQLSTWKICLFWAFLRTTSSTWGSLSRTIMISQNYPIVRDQMGNINQFPRKITPNLSFRTPDQPEPGEQGLQIWVCTRGKGAVPDRELLSSTSTGKVSCPVSLFPVFQEVFSFHNGAHSGMLTWALPANIPKEMELNNTTALHLQHPVSTSLAAAGEPWAKIQNWRQKIS